MTGPPPPPPADARAWVSLAETAALPNVELVDVAVALMKERRV